MKKRYLAVILTGVLLTGCSNNTENNSKSDSTNTSSIESFSEPSTSSTEKISSTTPNTNNDENFYAAGLKEKGTVAAEGSTEDGAYMVIIDKGNKEGHIYYQFPNEPIRDSIVRVADTIGILQDGGFSDFDKLTMEWAKYDSDFPIAVFMPSRDSKGQWTAILPISWLSDDFMQEYGKMQEEFNNIQKANSSESTNEVVIYDKNDILIKYRSWELSRTGCIEVNIYIENNTGKDLFLITKDFSAEGYQMIVSGTWKVNSGKKLNDSITIYKTEMEKNSLSKVKSIEFYIDIQSIDKEISYKTDNIELTLR